MKVELVSVTSDALNVLLKTKNTRLSHDDDPTNWSAEKKAEHLAYMLDTIKSSWEFVDYEFLISGVTRVFTHQIVRTRHGSYAQQAMRVVDARDFEVLVPETVKANSIAAAIWANATEVVMNAYAKLIDLGIPAQDARGILPNNILTEITAKFNLRTLHEMAKLRLCTRTQGEYQDVFREMRRLVIETHPWAAPFIEVHCVATGTCAFPRYGKAECPVYLPEMNNDHVRAAARERFWSLRHEARPMAKDGKAM